MNKKRKNRDKPNHYRPNVWGALRDILIAAMNKGQFPFAIIGLILCLIIYKMPAEDVTILANKMIQLLVDWKLLGWTLSLVLTIGWVFTSRKLRILHANEVKRIGNEKKALQERELNKKLKSSD